MKIIHDEILERDLFRVEHEMENTHSELLETPHDRLSL